MLQPAGASCAPDESSLSSCSKREEGAGKVRILQSWDTTWKEDGRKRHEDAAEQQEICLHLQ